MKNWSKNWKNSKKPHKQRKYAAQAPLHIKSKLLGAHLSKELREKHKIRSLRIRTGDKVTVLTGGFKKKTGKVERADTDDGKVFVTGIAQVKKDGSKALVPLRPSNLLITELNLSDKKRLEVKK